MAVHGLLGLGGAQVALTLDALREVVPCPDHFEAVPTRARGFLGVLVLRELVIPVVDVRVLTGLPDDDQGDKVIAIVTHDDRTIGLLADGVRGLLDIEPGDVLPMSPGSGAAVLFSGCVQHPDGSGVVSVLSPGTLFGLPGIPTLTTTQPADAATDGIAARHATDAAAFSTMMIVHCGEMAMAIDVEAIQSVVPIVELHRSVLEDVTCRGTIDHQGARIPVVDLPAHLGFPALEGHRERQAVVVTIGEGHVALLVDRVVEITRVRLPDIHPVPAVGVDHPERFAGVWRPDGARHHLVVDHRWISTDEVLAALARLNVADDTVIGEESEGEGSRSGRRLLVYSVGTDVASDLADVVEILPFPDELVASNGASPAVLGLFQHRQAAVPVVSLTTLLGRAADVDDQAGRVVIVDDAGRRIAFVVAELHAIERSFWEEAPKASTPMSSEDMVAAAPLGRIGEDEERARLLPIVDLRAVVRLLCGEPAGSDTDAGRDTAAVLAEAAWRRRCRSGPEGLSSGSGRA